MKKAVVIALVLIVMCLLVFSCKEYEGYIDKNIDTMSKSYDLSAQAAGNNGKFAQERYYNIYGTYTSDLGKLLEMDKNLADDPGVTFSFKAASTSGYTFYTQHASSKTGKTFTFTMKPGQ